MADPVTAGAWAQAEVQATDPRMFVGEVDLRTLPSSGGEAPGMAWVRFIDGARTNWHTHVGGQVLYVLEGEGCVGSVGYSVLPIRPGDLVRIPAGVRHWHGALSGKTMMHVSVTCGETHWPDPPQAPPSSP